MLKKLSHMHQFESLYVCFKSYISIANAFTPIVLKTGLNRLVGWIGLLTSDHSGSGLIQFDNDLIIGLVTKP